MSENMRADDLQFVWHPFHQAAVYKEKQLIAVGGEGPYVIDEQGKKYLDAISGLWNLNLGYSEHRIASAVYEQLKRMPFTSLIVFSHEPSIRLAKCLAERAPGDLDTVFFTSGGSEGVETAIKLARHTALVRGESIRQKIFALRGSYHGMSYGALSVTGITQDRWQFGSLLPEIVHLASPQSFYRINGNNSSEALADMCVAEVERALAFHEPRTVAAMIVEPVMGVGGMIPPPFDYLRRLRKLCDENGILLIFDEVASGYGRTGALFAADRFGVTPDMLVLAKGMSAGYVPMGAVIVSRALSDLCQTDPSSAFMHGFTYGGSPAGCVAALTCLEIIESEGLLEKVRDDGEFMLSALKDALARFPHVQNIRGVGLMLGLDLIDPSQQQPANPALGARIIKIARERGVIVRTTYGGSTFNFAPPFICSRDELTRIVETFSSAVEEAVGEVLPRGAATSA